MTTYTFDGADGKPLIFKPRKTTPNTVAAFTEAFEAYLVAEENAEATTLRFLYDMMPLALEPTSADASYDWPDVDYDEFDVKLAQEAVADFLPSGTAILKALGGF
jgi:hypothetical protein